MDFFTGRADVIVCDGFVGNILMKFTEGIGKALAPFLARQLSSSMTQEEIDRITSELWHLTNLPRTMGGPLFGINGVVVVGHGSCQADGIAGAINTAIRCVKIDLVESMREELSQMRNLGNASISSLQRSPQAPG
jgi:glycerol-3-phosphate acyltransferase PlsX